MAEQNLRGPGRVETPTIANPARTQSSTSASQTPSQRPVTSIESIDTAVQRTRTPLQSPANQSLFRVPESPRSVGPDSQLSRKIAIPRLKRPAEAGSEASTRSGGRHRVNHACEPCRHRKTKCSGERPVCRHCQDFKIACFYADGKRDRVKKQFGSMTEKVSDYEKLLKELQSRVGEDDARLIRSILDKATITENNENSEKLVDGVPPEGEGDDEDSGEESEASAAVGSTGALDRAEEDFTREEARSTGFMGKNSEVTWMQRLRQENKYGTDNGKSEDPDLRRMEDISSSSFASKGQVPADLTTLQEADTGLAAHESSYHLDDLSVTAFEAVDLYEVPPAETANVLFETYLARVHSTFPIIAKVNMTAQFQKFISGQVQRPPDKWLAILNLIFAISAKYGHLVDADWKGDERDHLIYFARARMLSTSGETFFQHPDLQQIQIFGLFSFYLLCTSQINRSWFNCGIAIRAATALGMNMRNESQSLRDSLKEMRYRVWWSIYSLEHRLCSMTGRPNSIIDEHCTCPLPAPIEEERFESDEGQKFLCKDRQQGDRNPMHNIQVPTGSNPTSSATPSTDRSRSHSGVQTRSPSNQTGTSSELAWAKDVPPSGSLYFLHLVQITRITHVIFQRLYNPIALGGTWSEVQSVIREVGLQLEIWYRNLPAILDFRRKQRDREFYDYRLTLGFLYYGAKMTAHRPCLCRLDRKMPNQSTKSYDFNRQAAQTCVECAQDMLRMIPDEPNAVGLIRVGPWWGILHWLVQAATVLMLEISFRAHHMPEEADSILESSKKAVRWLHALGEDNLSAARAWQLTDKLLRDAAKKIGREIHDLPTQTPGRAVSSAEEAMSDMSGIQSMGQNFNMHGFQQSTMPMFTAPMTNDNFPAYAAYDPLMGYDQYFPMGNSMPHYQQPSAAEIEFMSSAYHEQQRSEGGSA